MGNDIGWKVYDGKEPLESFLERNKPSQINNTDAPWISVRCEDDDQEQEDESNYGSASMRTEWEGLIKNKRVKKVTAETLRDLALKYKYTSGKWMIFGSSEQIDDLWFTVAEAVVTCKLGSAAKVSTKNPNQNHVICVYTKDFTDEADVRRVEKGLRDSNIRVGMSYKADIYTTLNIYAKNSLGIPVSIFRSQAL